MKNILTIVRSDIRRITRNVSASIVVFGLIVIPLLFTWFNVLASWDPFGNTSNLKIAVASEDEGHVTDLAPLRLNLGEQVLAQLSLNNDLDWVITDVDEAIDGTESGEYYAAIVLPPTFSTDLLTFYVDETDPSEVTLYTNQKKNALAGTIVSQGASGVTAQINTSFTKIVSEVGLGLVTSLNDYLQEDQTQQALNQMDARLEGVSSQLRSSAQSVSSLSALVDSSIPLVDSAGRIASAAGAQLSTSGADTGAGSQSTDGLASTLETSAQSLSTSLDATSQSFDLVGQRVDELFANADSTSASASDTFNTLAERVGQQVGLYESVREELNTSVAPNLPADARPGYNDVIASLDEAIARQQTLQERFTQTASDISAGNTTSQENRQATTDAVNDAKTAIDDARSTYDTQLRPQLDQLGNTLDTIRADLTTVGAEIDQATAALSNSPGSVQNTLVNAKDVTAGLADTLNRSANDFDQARDAIQRARDTGDFSQLADLVGSNPEQLASALSTPIEVKREPVFPVASFGVAMTPLYTTLALWVGALLSGVVLRASVTRKDVEDEAADDADDVEEKQEYSRIEQYFGRFGIFALIGLAQSTLVVLGLIIFVQIEPAHPLLLFLVAWLASLVFMLIVYTLVFSFGNAGKAVAVVLLVLQISAAGGSYPLELLPQWFQNLSPWLPATHSIAAMRSAIAGTYEGDFWISLGWLALFILPTLLLGVVLRPLLDGYNRSMSEAMEKTKLM
ncbi:YhgE/Pip domain-containing protein [Corynebacterium lubricantis]|uniref:YhgE/Pip domain-containing protein n=1 Tax=Corynebacterium lubricantis TaxID=541095 RepID=UPI00036A69E4|nr:YhgE/Pip domain-containing protein [Corynebacterium lubricantis]